MQFVGRSGDVILGKKTAKSMIGDSHQLTADSVSIQELQIMATLERFTLFEQNPLFKITKISLNATELISRIGAEGSAN